MMRRASKINANYTGDLRGTAVYGSDNQKLGTVDDALLDDRTDDLRYLVIDAGWLSARQFLLPADQVYAFGEGADLYANLRRADAEALPQFDDEMLATDGAFTRYESDYRLGWHYDADPTRYKPSPRLTNFRGRMRDSTARPYSETARPYGETSSPYGEMSKVKPSGAVTTVGARPTGVYGTFETRADVERAVDKLREQGFNSQDISVLFPDRDLNKEFAIEKNTKAPEGALAGGGTGLIVGGALGWLVGIGTLAIPGIGPLLVAGPIVAALAGAGVGSAVGGIAGALIGLGVPELEARRYEEEVKRGRILVSVHCDSVGIASTARTILESSGAKDVFLSGEQLAA